MMKFYSLSFGMAAVATGTNLWSGFSVEEALAKTHCYANPFNDQAYEIWTSTANQAQMSLFLDPCPSYFLSSFLTTGLNQIWEEFQDQVIVDLNNPKNDKLVSLKESMTNFYQNLISEFFNKKGYVYLFNPLSEVANGLSGFATAVLRDYFRTILATDSLDWDAEEASPEDFFRQASAAFKNVFLGLDLQYLEQGSLRLVEILRPVFTE